MVKPLQPLVHVDFNASPGEFYLETLGKGSQRAMRSALNRLAELASNGLATHASCPWQLWTYSHSQVVKMQLERRYKPATVNRHLTALRGVLKAAWHLGIMAESQHRSAISFSNIDIPSLPHGDTTLGKSALKKLFASCDKGGPRAARDAAILALLYGCGLRRLELVGLNLEDYSPDTHKLRVLSGRGAEARIAYPPGGAQEALALWLELRGLSSGPLFTRVRRGDHIQTQRISAQSVLLIVQERASQAGLGPMTAHQLRQSFISNLLDVGAPLHAVQHLAGHRHAASTLRYDSRQERAKEEAARKVFVPYVKPTTPPPT